MSDRTHADTPTDTPTDTHAGGPILDPGVELDADLRALLDDYFELMHSQDMARFDRVFHPESTLYSAQGGEGLSLRPRETYREQMLGRQSPASRGEPRRDRVLMVDRISPTLALAKVQLEMMGGVMQDYLNLVHLDGQWWIMAKMWERVGDSEA
jgi:hypothetical protein